MDHGGQTGKGLHKGRDHDDVSQFHLLRKQRLRSAFRRGNLLRKAARRTDGGGERDADRHGEQTHPLQSRPQSRKGAAEEEFRYRSDAESGFHFQGRTGFHPPGTDRVELRGARPQRRTCSVFPGHDPSGDERQGTPPFGLRRTGRLFSGFTGLDLGRSVRLAGEEPEDRRLQLQPRPGRTPCVHYH